MPDVYLIRNRVNGKVYVGGTFNSVSWAWEWHMKLSKSDSANLLQKDIRKYGQDSFEVKILYPNLPLKFLDEMIEYGRRVFKSTDPRSGYNVRESPEKSSRPIGRPRIHATDAERKRAYRQRRTLREGRTYGQRWSRYKSKPKQSRADTPDEIEHNVRRLLVDEPSF
jgi:group I intron endonuclease